MNEPTIAGDVHCDKPTCQWTTKVSNVFDWREEPCPHCGHPLLSDSDRVALDGLKALMQAGLAYAPGKVPEGVPVVKLTLDTREAIRTECERPVPFGC